MAPIAEEAGEAANGDPGSGYTSGGDTDSDGEYDGGSGGVIVDYDYDAALREGEDVAAPIVYSSVYASPLDDDDNDDAHPLPLTEATASGNNITTDPTSSRDVSGLMGWRALGLGADEEWGVVAALMRPAVAPDSNEDGGGEVGETAAARRLLLPAATVDGDDVATHAPLHLSGSSIRRVLHDTLVPLLVAQSRLVAAAAAAGLLHSQSCRLPDTLWALRGVALCEQGFVMAAFTAPLFAALSPSRRSLRGAGEGAGGVGGAVLVRDSARLTAWLRAALALSRPGGDAKGAEGSRDRHRPCPPHGMLHVASSIGVAAGAATAPATAAGAASTRGGGAGGTSTQRADDMGSRGIDPRAFSISFVGFSASAADPLELLLSGGLQLRISVPFPLFLVVDVPAAEGYATLFSHVLAVKWVATDAEGAVTAFRRADRRLRGCAASIVGALASSAGVSLGAWDGLPALLARALRDLTAGGLHAHAALHFAQALHATTMHALLDAPWRTLCDSALRGPTPPPSVAFLAEAHAVYLRACTRACFLGGGDQAAALGRARRLLATCAGVVADAWRLLEAVEAAAELGGAAAKWLRAESSSSVRNSDVTPPSIEAVLAAFSTALAAHAALAASAAALRSGVGLLMRAAGAAEAASGQVGAPTAAALTHLATLLDHSRFFSRGGARSM